MGGICEFCNQEKSDIQEVVTADPERAGTWRFCVECLEGFESENEIEAELQCLMAIQIPEVWQ